MKLTKCNNGHFFDADKFSYCPHCSAVVDINQSVFDEKNKNKPNNLFANLDIESYQGNEPYVFISYSHDDEIMKDMFMALKDNNVRFWYDNGIKSGAIWRKTISEKINGCISFIVFISKNSVVSENVKDELFFADDKNKKIEFIYLEDVELDDEMHLRFGRRQYISRAKYNTFNDFIKKFLSIIDPRAIEKSNEVNIAFEELSKRYKNLSVLKSSISTNYLAVDSKTDAKVFIKHISFNNTYLGTIRNDIINNELTVLKKLHNCPYCIHLYDYFEDSNNMFIVQNYVDGINLQKYLKQKGALDVDTAMEIASDVAEILCYFYNMSPRIVHMDIKPDNIILPSAGHIYLIDFGIAKLMNSGGKDYTAPKTIMGTQGYASPEQYRGVADTRTDIFALGVTLFQMISGINDFRQVESFDLKIHSPNTPSVIADIVLKATNNDINKRYQTPMEFLHDLNHYKDLGKTFSKFSKKESVFINDSTWQSINTNGLSDNNSYFMNQAELNYDTQPIDYSTEVLTLGIVNDTI